MKKSHIANAAIALLIATLPASSAGNSQYAQAVADYNAGRYGKAAAEFEVLKGMYPTNALTRYYLALSRQALGHFEKARQEYEYVSMNGDANLKGLAAQGLARMSGARTSVSSPSASASGGSSNSPTQSTRPPVTAKVKKILEFYADW